MLFRSSIRGPFKIPLPPYCNQNSFTLGWQVIYTNNLRIWRIYQQQSIEFLLRYLQFLFRIGGAFDQRECSISSCRFLDLFKTRDKVKFYIEQKLQEESHLSYAQRFFFVAKWVKATKDRNCSTLYQFANEEKRINKCFGTLRRFIKLFLVSVHDLEKFLKINPFKYKFSEVREYLEIKTPMEMKLENP
jgi:hypothetical protein